VSEPYDIGTNRVYLGQPQTVGQLRELLSTFSDDMPLAHRNAPLPSFWFWGDLQYGGPYVEVTAVDGVGGSVCKRRDMTGGES
jgi:hypothetical protein